MTKHTNASLTSTLSRTTLSTEISRAFSLRPKLSLMAGCTLMLGQMAITTNVNAINISELDGSNGFTLTAPSGFNSSRATPMVVGDINGDHIDDIIVDLSSNPRISFIVFGRQGNGFPAEVDASQFDGTDGFKVIGDFRGTGDINHDGNTDLLFRSDSSSAFVIYGQQASNPFPASLEHSQINGSNGFIISDPANNGSISVASQGDVSGDGIDDFLVLEKHDTRHFGYYNTETLNSLYVILGQDNTAVNNGSMEFLLSQTDGNNGFRIQNIFTSTSDYHGGSGIRLSDKNIDINGDNINDIFYHLGVTGYAYDYDAAAFLILKPLAENGEFPAVIDGLPNVNTYENFVTTPFIKGGAQFNPIGDINGDSAEDLFAMYDEPSSEGVVGTIALGDQNAVAGDVHTGEINLIDDSSSRDRNFGNGYALGDFNGDGFNDVLFEHSFNRGIQEQISASVLFGRNTLSQGSFPDSINHTYFDGVNGIHLNSAGLFGRSITSPADINGDSIKDIVSFNSDRYETRVAVVYGRKTPFPAIISVDSLEPSDGFMIDGFASRFPYSMSVGDINNDSADDIVVGTQKFPTEPTPSYVVFGQPSQRKVNIVPILDLLLNDEPGGSQP